MPMIKPNGVGQMPENRVYHSMIQRCTNPKRDNYQRYGGAGVSVCSRWLDSFIWFLIDVGPRPSPRHQLDRFPDNTGNYEPGNVRWATPEENGRNKPSNILLTLNDLTLPVSAWAERLNVPVETIHWRIKKGLPVDKILSLERGKGRALGERNGRTNLTDSAVLEIKQRLASGESHRSIARLFGIGKTTVTSIGSGGRWRHVSL